MVESIARRHLASSVRCTQHTHIQMGAPGFFLQSSLASMKPPPAMHRKESISADSRLGLRLITPSVLAVQTTSVRVTARGEHISPASCSQQCSQVCVTMIQCYGQVRSRRLWLGLSIQHILFEITRKRCTAWCQPWPRAHRPRGEVGDLASDGGR